MLYCSLPEELQGANEGLHFLSNIVGFPLKLSELVQNGVYLLETDRPESIKTAIKDDNR